MALETYDIPSEAAKVLNDGILRNPLHRDLPAEIRELGRLVQFVGTSLPSIPINWRFAESVAALKGFEACMINTLLVRKYNESPKPVVINTDHAQLFFMSAMLLQVEPKPNSPLEPTPVRDLSAKYRSYFPDEDLHQMASSLYRRAATNIYKTKDGRCFHIHGSLNPDPSLEAIEMPRDMPEVKTQEQGWNIIQARIAQETAAHWDNLLGEDYRQAATVCWSVDEFSNSAHGRANAGVGLYEIHPWTDTHDTQTEGCWWPDSLLTSPQRPLAGLKVIDLTRVIAGPAISRGLAELGASVMRVTAAHLADFSGLHPDLNWGKWNCRLDLRQEVDRVKLRGLVQDADVVLNGYRPGVLDKYGFSHEEMFELCRRRERGIIYVRENCFGWHGPWAHRSGWQPISDANCGISTGFGRAMGNDEAVTPVFPNSDYCTGIIGVCATLHALLQRGHRGGSYLVDTSLNYYSTWLANSVSEYPKRVWEDVWTRNGKVVLRHSHSMNYSIPLYLDMVKNNRVLADLEFFETRRSYALQGLSLRCVKPILQFPENTVKLGYDIGTRGNGTDEARWPDDLATENVGEAN